MTQVAFLGLGAIGTPMARHLAAPPFSLRVWNRTHSRAEVFEKETGAHAAATPAEAVRGAEVAVTCLPISADVEALLDGDAGLLAAMSPGSVLVDCTSGDPAISRRIAARLAERGIGFVDAAVSGGISGAEKGILAVMCGGEAELVERVRPVLSSFGEAIVHCGSVGAGHAVKAVNNALVAINLWTVAEGLATLKASGVSPAIGLEAINASSGRSLVSQSHYPQRVLNRSFPLTFRLALLDKDIGIAAGMARAGKVPSPVLQQVAELLHMAHRELGGDADHAEVAKIVERWAGVEIS